MVAICCRERPLPGEDPLTFLRRRRRSAAGVCKRTGKWSTWWFRRACAWDQHLSRHENQRSWAARLRTFRGRTWLQERRAAFLGTATGNSQVGSCNAGRTGTRTFPGRPYVRWHDGIEYARQILPTENLSR